MYEFINLTKGHKQSCLMEYTIHVGVRGCQVRIDWNTIDFKGIHTYNWQMQYNPMEIAIRTLNISVFQWESMGKTMKFWILLI